MNLWDQVWAGVRSWARETVADATGRSPAARTLSPFDDPLLSPVRLVLDPLHVTRPFLGFLAKSGALERSVDPLSLALTGIVGREGVERAKEAPSFTEAGERLVGANPLSRGVFFLADIVAPGPGEIRGAGKLVREADTAFSALRQVRDARYFFDRLGLRPSQTSYPASFLPTLLESGLGEEVADLDLAFSLEKTYKELEQAARELPIPLVEGVQSLAKEQAERLYQSYQKVRDSLSPEAQAKTLLLLIGLEGMAESPRPWRWLETFERNRVDRLGNVIQRAEELPLLLEGIFLPRFLRNAPSGEAPLLGIEDLGEAIENGDLFRLARISPSFQIVSWALDLSDHEARALLERNWGEGLIGPITVGRWEVSLRNLAEDTLREGFERTQRLFRTALAQVDPSLRPLFEASQEWIQGQLEEALVRENPVRGIFAIKDGLEELLFFLDAAGDPGLAFLRSLIETEAAWAEQAALAIQHGREAVSFAQQLDALIRKRLERGEDWERIRNLLAQHVLPQAVRFSRRLFDRMDYV